MVSSSPRISMPRWANTSQSYFRFCAILSTALSSSSGLRAASASASGIWSAHSLRSGANRSEPASPPPST